MRHAGSVASEEEVGFAKGGLPADVGEAGRIAFCRGIGMAVGQAVFLRQGGVVGVVVVEGALCQGFQAVGEYRAGEGESKEKGEWGFHGGSRLRVGGHGAWPVFFWMHYSKMGCAVGVLFFIALFCIL